MTSISAKRAAIAGAFVLAFTASGAALAQYGPGSNLGGTGSTTSGTISGLNTNSAAGTAGAGSCVCPPTGNAPGTMGSATGPGLGFNGATGTNTNQPGTLGGGTVGGSSAPSTSGPTGSSLGGSSGVGGGAGMGGTPSGP